MNCLAYNLYLCDLEFLGAEISFMDEKRKRGLRCVRVTMYKGGSYDLFVKPSPQGYRVIKVANMSLLKFSEIVSRQLNLGTELRYVLFVKQRRIKVVATHFLAAQMFLLTLQWILEFFFYGMEIKYAIMSLLALAMVMDSFFLRREVLKKTYKDFCRQQRWQE